MLIEQRVFNFNVVDDRSFMDIKNECLIDFAYKLKDLLQSDEERHWGVWNYKTFQDNFSTNIKYNTKSIVFEETVYNREPWGVKETCQSCYGLEFVPETEEHSSYYKVHEQDIAVLTHPNVCTACVKDKCQDEVSSKNLIYFDEYFGKGEFPYITITVIRLGNKDHYFYTIHR